MIGSFLGPAGTLLGAGIGGLVGAFGGPRNERFSPDQFNPDPTNQLGQRYDQLLDPNYGRADMLQAARSLAPGQSDFFNRLRGSGLGTGVSSALAQEQFRAAQGRAVGQGVGAFAQFRAGQQGAANDILGMISRNNQFSQQMALQARTNNQDRRDSFANSFLSGGFGLAGNMLGQGGFGGGQ
jgi:hypothetical protein